MVISGIITVMHFASDYVPPTPPHTTLKYLNLSCFVKHPFFCCNIAFSCFSFFHVTSVSLSLFLNNNNFLTLGIPYRVTLILLVFKVFSYAAITFLYFIILLTAGTFHKISGCKGDSGGPLMCGSKFEYVAGILSMGSDICTGNCRYLFQSDMYYLWRLIFLASAHTCSNSYILSTSRHNC